MKIQLGTFAVRTQFLVVGSLAVSSILGTAYIGRYVKATHFIYGVVDVLDGSSVSIHSVHGAEEGSTPEQEDKSATARSNKVRVAHAARIGALSEAEIWVQTDVGGLTFLQSATKPHEKGLMMAHGIADPLPLQPFRALVMNL